MPNLPDYTSPAATRGVEPSGRGIAAVEEEGRAWNSALHQIGGAAKDIGDTLERHYALEDATNRAAKAPDFTMEQQQSWQRAKAQGVSAKDWFDNSYTPALQSFQDKLAPTSKTGQVQNEEWAATHASSTARQVVGDQMSLDADKSHAAIEDSRNKFANLAAQHPENVAEYAGQLTSNVKDLAAAGQLDNKDIATLATDSRQRVYDSAIKGIVARAEAPGATPAQIDAAKAAIEKDDFVSNTSPGVYVSALDSLTKAKTSQINIQGNIAALALGDVNKQIALTGDLDMYQRGLGLIAGIQEATPNATAMKQAEERKKLDDAFVAGRVTSGVMTAPAKDLDQAVKDFDTRYKSETDPQKLGVYGSQRTAIDTALKRRTEELKQDASKYALTYSPTVQQSYAQYQQAAPQDKAKAFQQYAAVTTGFQQMVNPGKPANVMTDDVRSQARQAISTIRQPGGAAAATGSMAQMAQTYGSYWPQMAEQLRHEKIFSGDEGVAARLYANPESQALGETILNASALKGGERFAMHQIPEAQALGVAIPAFGPLSRSLANSGAAGVDFMSAYQTALAHAIQYTGTKDAAGVKVLAGKMALNQFTFPSAMPTLRIGNDLHIDADRVADGAVAVRADMPNHKLFVPPSYGGLGAKDQAINYGKQIASTGKWYTNEQGTGALLYDEDGHNVQEYAAPPKFDTSKAPGMVEKGNVDPWNRPVLHNPDGGYSTTDSISIGTDKGETVIPRVIDGKRLTNAEAIAHYKKTGENLGTFKTVDQANKYATDLHNAQATMYDKSGNPRRVDVELKWEDLGKVADKQPLRATFKAAAGAVDKALGGK